MMEPSASSYKKCIGNDTTYLGYINSRWIGSYCTVCPGRAKVSSSGKFLNLSRWLRSNGSITAGCILIDMSERVRDVATTKNEKHYCVRTVFAPGRHGCNQGIELLHEAAQLAPSMRVKEIRALKSNVSKYLFLNKAISGRERSWTIAQITVLCQTHLYWKEVPFGNNS